MKKMIAMLILSIYTLEAVLLVVQAGKILGGSYVLLFPIGILLPKCFERCRKPGMIIGIGTFLNLILITVMYFAGNEILIFREMFRGEMGMILGYGGYLICELTSESVNVKKGIAKS